MKEILFICTGNTCRSPMAEALCRAMLGDEVAVSSAGLWALPGQPMAANALLALAERGIDGSAHRARAFSPDMLGEDTLAVCMAGGHLAAVLAACPGARAVKLAQQDIADPYGGPLSAYRAACAQIEAALKALAAQITKGEM